MARLHFQREPAEVEIDIGGGEKFFVTLRPLAYGVREQLLHRLRTICLRVEREFDAELGNLTAAAPPGPLPTYVARGLGGEVGAITDGRARAFMEKLMRAREHGLDLATALNAALEPVYRELCRAAVIGHRELSDATGAAITFIASEGGGASDATLDIYAAAEAQGLTLTAHIAQAVLKTNRLDGDAKKK